MSCVRFRFRGLTVWGGGGADGGLGPADGQTNAISLIQRIVSNYIVRLLVSRVEYFKKSVRSGPKVSKNFKNVFVGVVLPGWVVRHLFSVKFFSDELVFKI